MHNLCKAQCAASKKFIEKTSIYWVCVCVFEFHQCFIVMYMCVCVYFSPYKYVELFKSTSERCLVKEEEHYKHKHKITQQFIFNRILSLCYYATFVLCWCDLLCYTFSSFFGRSTKSMINKNIKVSIVFHIFSQPAKEK